MPAQTRGDRLAAIGIVLLGIVVLSVALVALNDPDRSQAAAPTKASASTSPRTTSSATAPRTTPRTTVSPTPAFDPKLVPLVVMNNTTTTGLAAGAQARLQRAGWRVTGIGTMSDTIKSTCAYYDPAQPDAKRAAKALRRQYPTIKRIAPRFAGLAAGPVVVVLTWDYQPG